MRTTDNPTTSAGACTRITFEVNTHSLDGYTDEYISQLWHISQANPAPFGDKAACEFAERVGREIIRRFVAAQSPALWVHTSSHIATRQRLDAEFPREQPADEPAPAIQRESQVPTIGQPWPEQGGIYLGTFKGQHLIVGTHALASFDGAWGERGEDVAGAKSRFDGKANTAAMWEAGSPIAKTVLSLNIEGHTDWFIPSQAQLQHACAHAPEAFDPEPYHWSSTQVSAGSAFVQDFQDGNSHWDLKDDERRVRAFRAIQLQPLTT